MITESTLTAVLADEARDVSEPSDVVARLSFEQPAVTRRRWIAPLAAAAAVVTVVAAAAALPGSHRGTPAGTGGPTLPLGLGRGLYFSVAVGAVTGYKPGSPYLATDREATDIQLASDDEVTAGEVVAYSLGSYDPTAVRAGRSVSVQGHQAYYALTTSSADQVDGVPHPRRVPTLAWQFAPDRWVVVQGWDATGTPALQRLHLDPLTEETRVARAVDTSVVEPLLLPYKVGYLPDGLRRGGGRDSGIADDWQSYLWFVSGRQGSTAAAELSITASAKRYAGDVHGTFTIDGHPAVYEPEPVRPRSSPPLPSAMSSRPTDTRAPSPGRVVVPGGVTVIRPNPSLTVDFGPAVLTIAGSYSKDELVQIARSITLAGNVDDRSDWFDATK